MKTSLAVGVAGLLLASAGGLLVVAHRTPADPAGSPLTSAGRKEAPPVVSAPVSPAAPNFEFLGVVFAHTTVDVSAPFDSRLDSVDVRIGDRVRRGARVATLDVRSAQQDMVMAEASLRAAEAEHDQAALELSDTRTRLERLTRLSDLVSAEQAATGRYQAERADARLAQVRAQVSERRARVGQLREMIADAAVRAPFDGVVATRYLDAGATVARGAPIVRVISPEALWVRFGVPEARAGDIAVGKSVSARLESTSVTVPGTITRVAPDIDPALQMYVAEATLTLDPAARGAVSAGAIARVSLEVVAESGQR